MTKKFSDWTWAWSFLEWIFYFSLFATGIWFTKESIVKFFNEDTGIKQYEGEIESFPTITLCMMATYGWHSDQFIVGYQIYNSKSNMGFIVDEMKLLEIGENQLETLNETVTLKTIYAKLDAICYALTTTEKVSGRKHGISIRLGKDLANNGGRVYFASERNSYGITQR